MSFPPLKNHPVQTLSPKQEFFPSGPAAPGGGGVAQEVPQVLGAGAVGRSAAGPKTWGGRMGFHMASL